MIFVDHIIDVQSMKKILDFALSADCQRFHLWTNPDERVSGKLSNRFAPFLLKQQKCEAVTLYDEDTELIKSINCFRFNSSTIEILLKELDRISNSIGSIAIYKKGIPEWFLCMIFHEHMTLVRPNEKELATFRKTELPHSLEPPPNW